jgi:hypothetical protein
MASYLNRLVRLNDGFTVNINANPIFIRINDVTFYVAVFNYLHLNAVMGVL